MGLPGVSWFFELSDLCTLVSLDYRNPGDVNGHLLLLLRTLMSKTLLGQCFQKNILKDDLRIKHSYIWISLNILWIYKTHALQGTHKGSLHAIKICILKVIICYLYQTKYGGKRSMTKFFSFNEFLEFDELSKFVPGFYLLKKA